MRGFVLLLLSNPNQTRVCTSSIVSHGHSADSAVGLLAGRLVVSLVSVTFSRFSATVILCCECSKPGFLGGNWSCVCMCAGIACRIRNSLRGHRKSRDIHGCPTHAIFHGNDTNLRFPLRRTPCPMSQSFGSDRIALSKLGGHTRWLPCCGRKRRETPRQRMHRSAGMETTGNDGLVPKIAGVVVCGFNWFCFVLFILFWSAFGFDF